MAWMARSMQLRTWRLSREILALAKRPDEGFRQHAPRGFIKQLPDCLQGLDCPLPHAGVRAGREA